MSFQANRLGFGRPKLAKNKRINKLLTEKSQIFLIYGLLNDLEVNKLQMGGGSQ